MINTIDRPALTARGLRKTFGDTVALDGVDLSVTPGTISRCSDRTFGRPGRVLLGGVGMTRRPESLVSGRRIWSGA
jgi:hypothetical protein